MRSETEINYMLDRAWEICDDETDSEDPAYIIGQTLRWVLGETKSEELLAYLE